MCRIQDQRPERGEEWRAEEREKNDEKAGDACVC